MFSYVRLDDHWVREILISNLTRMGYFFYLLTSMGDFYFLIFEVLSSKFMINVGTLMNYMCQEGSKLYLCRHCKEKKK